MRFNLIETAHRGRLETYRARLDNYRDPYAVYRDSFREIHRVLNTHLILRLRFFLCLNILFVKHEGTDEEVSGNFYFCSNCERILSSYQIQVAIRNAFKKIFNAIDVFIRNGSGWSIKNIEYLDIHIGRYRELRGGCRNVSLPRELKVKNALLSIDCDDDLCFLYCVAAQLFPRTRNAFRKSLYKREIQMLQRKNISFPMAISDIPLFENLNAVSIDVFGYEESEIFPIYLSEKNSDKIKIDLLLYQNHYFLIRNFNRLLSSNKYRKYFCKRCLNGFNRKVTLEKHQLLCILNKPQKTSVPQNGVVKFKNLAKMLYHPFCIFADFECITEKISNALPSDSKSYTVKLENHVPISYALLATDVNDRMIFHEYYCGTDAVSQFLQTLKRLTKKLIERIKQIIPLNDKKKSSSYNVNACNICGQRFLPNQIRVRDHNHWGDGSIRGLAHQACNLNYRATYFIPIIIHNFQNYDSHLILKNLPQKYARYVEIIPNNMEKFSMFTLNEMKFLDSYLFLDASLDNLIQNLIKSNHDFPLFNSFFENYEHRDLLKRKNNFPYRYFDSVNKLNETRLPPKSAFFNDLTGCDISDVEYQHALTVFEKFKCKTFSDYLQLYQNVDTVLLAEVFLVFRRTSLKYYSLDPVHYITSAQLTWDAGLKYSKVELKLLNCVDTYLWFESQMRGGISFLGTRYVKANNPFIPDTYNPNVCNNFILPLDCNNLYGFCLSQPLPIGNFAWLTESEIENFNILNTVSHSDVGYILEVDLYYPSSLHKKHDDFPLAVQHIPITYDMLSPYMQEMCDAFNLSSTLPCKKLVPNFFEKKNYITHYLNLKFYIQQGLVLKKIHRILSFSQQPFLKEYIHFNNTKRALARSEFEKAFFKKLNNSWYGKSIENVRKKINIRGSFDEEDCKKYLSNCALEEFQIINENFSVFKLKRLNLRLDKPIYVGFSVLELSKLHMYHLYYNYFKKYYKNRSHLVYIDTDSLYVNVETKNIREDLKQNQFQSILDLSNFPVDHPLHNDSNKAKLGCLKFETVSEIKQFIGLKSKMYAFEYADACKKKAKGIKKTF